LEKLCAGSKNDQSALDFQFSSSSGRFIMLESILLSIVLAITFGYIGIKVFGWIFDRPKSQEWHQRKLQEWKNTPPPATLPEHMESSLPYSKQ
jgi:hypothetical protein